MAYLLDVNVLIALIDRRHVHHDAAHQWFTQDGRQAWATCPLTENGVLRIVGHPRYPNSPGALSVVAQSMQSLRTLPGHRFWPDDLSLFESSLVDINRLLTSAQLTDSYLLALACANGGKLATLDRRLVVDAVSGGAGALHVIP